MKSLLSIHVSLNCLKKRTEFSRWSSSPSIPVLVSACSWTQPKYTFGIWVYIVLNKYLRMSPTPSWVTRKEIDLKRLFQSHSNAMPSTVSNQKPVTNNFSVIITLINWVMRNPYNKSKITNRTNCKQLTNFKCVSVFGKSGVLFNKCQVEKKLQKKFYRVKPRTQICTKHCRVNNGDPSSPSWKLHKTSCTKKMRTLERVQKA